MSGRTSLSSGPGLLGVYLNDHLAGATAGTELARRVAASQRDPARRGVMRTLAGEISEDRRALLEIMAALGVPARGYKVWAGWLAEKAGRLKLNGSLLARSPLSDLLELEMMRLGVEGKAAGWQTLRTLATGRRELDAARLDRLLVRARDQSKRLEELRTDAVAEAFRGSGV
ncbi:MAG: hypothetical protein ACRDNF_00090 [Streptosporangiaceae bacterium]